MKIFVAYATNVAATLVPRFDALFSTLVYLAELCVYVVYVNPWDLPNENVITQTLRSS